MRRGVAEEGGTGHYLPGSIASFIDSVAAKESFALRLNVVNYDGSVGKTQPLPIAGLTATGADAKSTGAGLTMFWRPAVEIGEGWSYAVSATVPTSGSMCRPTSAPKESRSRKTSVSGLGDIVLSR